MPSNDWNLTAVCLVRGVRSATGRGFSFWFMSCYWKFVTFDQRSSPISILRVKFFVSTFVHLSRSCDQLWLVCTFNKIKTITKFGLLPYMGEGDQKPNFMTPSIQGLDFGLCVYLWKPYWLWASNWCLCMAFN